MTNEDRLHQSGAGHAFSNASWLDTHFEACRAEYEAAFRGAGIRPGWRVLDAGCGSGSFIPWIAEAVGEGGHITALDLDAGNVATVRRRVADEWRLPCPVECTEGSLLDLPFADSAFDAVWCANVTQYLPDDDLRMAFREFRRVVRPGGLVAIKEADPHHFVFQPSAPGWFRRHYEDSLDRPGFNPVKGLFRVWALPQWLADAGLEPMRHTTSLVERRAPLRPVERVYVKSFLAAHAAIVLDRKVDVLPADDIGLWRAFSDPSAPDPLVDDPDFYWCEALVVSVGHVPGGE